MDEVLETPRNVLESDKPKRDELGRLLPGQVSLNPAGKPAGIPSFTSKVRAALQELNKEKGKTYERLLIEAILDKASTQKSSRVMGLVWNYLDGMPQQKVDHTSGGEKITGFNYIKPEDQKKEDSIMGNSEIPVVIEETKLNQDS
jgi:hypothetical protein